MIDKGEREISDFPFFFIFSLRTQAETRFISRSSTHILNVCVYISETRILQNSNYSDYILRILVISSLF